MAVVVLHNVIHAHHSRQFCACCFTHRNALRICFSTYALGTRNHRARKSIEYPA